MKRSASARRGERGLGASCPCAPGGHRHRHPLRAGAVPASGQHPSRGEHPLRAACCLPLLAPAAGSSAAAPRPAPGTAHRAAGEPRGCSPGIGGRPARTPRCPPGPARHGTSLGGGCAVLCGAVRCCAGGRCPRAAGEVAGSGLEGEREDECGASPYFSPALLFLSRDFRTIPPTRSLLPPPPAAGAGLSPSPCLRLARPFPAPPSPLGARRRAGPCPAPEGCGCRRARRPPRPRPPAGAGHPRRFARRGWGSARWWVFAAAASHRLGSRCERACVQCAGGDLGKKRPPARGGRWRSNPHPPCRVLPGDPSSSPGS